MGKRLFILAVGLFITTGFSTQAAWADERDVEHHDGQWSCESNNVRRSGPYVGYGDTKRNAQVEALRECRSRSIFPCWIVPDSCIYSE